MFIIPSDLSPRYFLHFAVVKQHDDKSEGLSRRMILAMVKKASGDKLTLMQAAHTWDRTILPYGQSLGLLTSLRQVLLNGLRLVILNCKRGITTKSLQVWQISNAQPWKF